MNTNLRCLSLFLSCYRITVKPKASDALCILPVEKCDYIFYVVQWEGWEQGRSQDIYITVLTRNCIPLLSEKSHEYCGNASEGVSWYSSLIQKLSKVIKGTLCGMYMAAFISQLGVQRYFIIFPLAQYCMNPKVSSRMFCYWGSGTKYIFSNNVGKAVRSVGSLVLTSHHVWEGIPII